MSRGWYFSHFTDVYAESEVQGLHLGLLGSTSGLFPLHCPPLRRFGGGVPIVGFVPGPDAFPEHPVSRELFLT